MNATLPPAPATLANGRASAPPPFTSGLEGVVAAQTRLSHVEGQRGELIIAG